MFRVVVLLAVCLPAMSQPRNESLDELFGQFYEDYLRENPERATSVGRTDHDTRWRDWSSEARRDWADRVKQYLADLGEFDPRSLNVQDQISATLLRRQLENELEGMPYQAYLLRLNQLFGLHTTVMLTLREMPARSEADFRNMLARMWALPDYVEQNIAVLREAIAPVSVEPKISLTRVRIVASHASASRASRLAVEQMTLLMGGHSTSLRLQARR